VRFNKADRKPKQATPPYSEPAERSTKSWVALLDAGREQQGEDMSSKIKIKVGQVEIEFEGSEEFLSKELPVLLKNVSSLYASVPVNPPGGDPIIKPPPPPGGQIQFTTNAIATKLSVKSGSDLLVAAAAHLTFVKRVQTFTRQQILNEMKTATSFYKKSYSPNFKKYLKTITDSGKLNELSTDAYAFSAVAKTDLERKLAH
jgi:hypothetical protein